MKRLTILGLSIATTIIGVLASCVGEDAESPETGDAAVADSPAASQETGGGDACVGCVADATPDAPDGGGFTPLAFSGLSLWLEASFGVESVGANLSAWRDRSPNKNDATPTSGSVGPTVGTLKGKPAIVLDAKGSLVIADKASLQWGTGDFIALAVVAHTQPTDGGTGPAYGEILAKQNVGTAPFPGPLLLANNSVTFKSEIVAAVEGSGGTVVTSSSQGYNDGVARLVGMRRKGTTLEIRINGAGAGSTTDAGIDRDVSAVGYDFSIGGHDATVRLKGTIAEIVAVKGATTDVELNALETYLISKYGL